jgi:hypothetical protein
MWFAGLKTWVGSGLLILSTFTPPIHASALRLVWNANTSSDIAEYRVYVGPAPGQYPNAFNVGNVTSISMTNLIPGTIYYFAVSAISLANLESPLSQPVSGQAPADGLALTGSLVSVGQYELRVQGPASGTYNIEESEDLLNWSPVAALPGDPSGQANYRVTIDRPKRFFRARVQ